MSPRAVRNVRLAFLALLALYGVSMLRAPGNGSLLDAVDLAIHETGHIVFSPFGEFIGVLGGTLFQLIVPLAFVTHFLWKHERFGAAVCLWWVAQNCWNISVYIADARTMALPLVGGGLHDWRFLLGEMGWLRSDAEISRAVHALGVVVFVHALGFGLMTTLGARPAGEEGDATIGGTGERAVG